MTYSIIGILAAVILLISNRDVLQRKEGRELSGTQKKYRNFLLGVLVYYFTDAAWGVLDAFRFTAVQYADTVIYFVTMIVSVLLWTRYVVSYLGRRNFFETWLRWVGQAFFWIELVIITVNLFYPVMFWFDLDGGYHAGGLRHLTLALQILLFLLTSIYTFYMTARTEGAVRQRHLTIGLFGLAMVILLAIQVAFPLWPFYAMGYMLGTCLLHSFVVEDEKEEYRRELEIANRAKTVFLSNMSHEIRTPMNAIIGLDSIALNDPEVTPAMREHLEKIGDSARHLLGIINDILDISRIESGTISIRSEEFSLAKTLAQVNTIIGGQCRDKGLHYDCQVKGGVSDYYIGDDMKLRQVLINILGNAVKFTPVGGSVNALIEGLGGDAETSTLRFTISDTGIGMGKEFLPRIFDAFSQEDYSSTSRYGSTGLGMSITRSLVELMGGKIEVKSEKAKGSEFVVTVPLLNSARKGGEVRETIDIRDMNVLVIDDDDIACKHARTVLGQVGINCDTAKSGVEGIEMAKLRLARMNPYNLILVDWRMPEMDGVETTRQLREIIGNEPPVIILTSYSWDGIEKEAKAAGVDTFVSKPLFAGAVLDEFREAFNKKNARLATGKVNLEGRRVLLAEDMGVNAEIMAMVLSMRQMEVEHAENGRIAVEMLREHEPGYYDAVLMDMRMPEMDGLEATRTIRAMERSDAKLIPIVALTANAFDEDVQNSMQAGLNAHLSKPVEPESLFETLESLLRPTSSIATRIS